MEVCRICAEPTTGDSKISIFDGTDPIANMIHQLSGLEVSLMNAKNLIAMKTTIELLYRYWMNMDYRMSPAAHV